MKQGDFVETIEAIYAVDLPERQWLTGVLETIGSWRTPNAGLVAFTWSMSREGTTVVGDMVNLGGPPAPVMAELLGSFAAEYNQIMSATLNNNRCGLSSAIVSPELFESYYGRLRPFGVADSLGINGRDTDRTGVFIGCHLAQVSTTSPAELRVYERLARHLVAGSRLRKRLAGRAPEDRDAAAILKPDGALEHATGVAGHREARVALREAVLAIEQARGGERQSDPEGAVGRWRVLADARYTLVDRFESDGRRYVVACENIGAGAAEARLTTRERQVVALYRLGMHSKLIAYELGVADPTVRVLLSRAAKRLGFSSPRSLRRKTERSR
jgi:DNA-binding CsgD family transcriptional regulator